MAASGTLAAGTSAPGAGSRKLINLQALRGVAVLAVVCFHLLTIEARYGGSATILPGWFNAGMLGVDLFFVISGYVMVTVTHGRFRSGPQARRFLWHRLTRIYPLYWIYATLALGVFLVRPEWINASQGGHVDVIASFLLIPQPILPIVQVGWTLTHEIYFYLVFFVVLLVVRERRLPWALAVWGVLVVVLGTQSLGPWWNVAFSPLTLEFIAGGLIAWFLRTAPAPRIDGRWLLLAAGLALAVAVALYVEYAAGTDRLPTGWQQVLRYGIPSAVIVFCVVQAERAGRLLPHALASAGDASYSTYLSHLFVINAVGRVWALVAGDGIVDNVVVLATTLGLVVVVGAMSYRYLELPLLRLARRVG